MISCVHCRRLYAHTQKQGRVANYCMPTTGLCDSLPVWGGLSMGVSGIFKSLHHRCYSIA